MLVSIMITFSFIVCSSPLGMQFNFIADSQITASSQWKSSSDIRPFHEGFYARLHNTTGVGWCSAYHATNLENEYLQV